MGHAQHLGCRIEINFLTIICLVDRWSDIRYWKSTCNYGCLYATNGDGRTEIYIQPFEPLASVGVRG